VPISFAEALTGKCTGCGAARDGVHWRAVDLVERPDLRDALVDGQLDIVRCQCGEGRRRHAALLVTRMDPAVPVLLAVPDVMLADPDGAVAAERALLDARMLARARVHTGRSSRHTRRSAICSALVVARASVRLLSAMNRTGRQRGVRAHRQAAGNRLRRHHGVADWSASAPPHR